MNEFEDEKLADEIAKEFEGHPVEFPYQLTLTKTERDAIDWVGHRYFSGDDLRQILWSSCDMNISETVDTDTCEWDSNRDITFSIPEYAAWEIRDGLESEDSFCPCFANYLRNKLREFCDEIV